MNGKLIIFILVIFAIISCADNHAIKKERVFFYSAVDEYGDIIKNSSNPQKVIVFEYSPKGLITKYSEYLDDKKIHYVREYRYDVKDTLIEVYHWEHLTTKLTKISDTISYRYYKDIFGAWVLYDYEKNEKNITNIQFISPKRITKSLQIVEIKDDDKCRMKDILGRMIEGEVKKYDKEGNWTKCVFTSTDGSFLILEREILEVWT